MIWQKRVKTFLQLLLWVYEEFVLKNHLFAYNIQLITKHMYRNIIKHKIIIFLSYGNTCVKRYNFCFEIETTNNKNESVCVRENIWIYTVEKQKLEFITACFLCLPLWMSRINVSADFKGNRKNFFQMRRNFFKNLNQFYGFPLFQKWQGRIIAFLLFVSLLL